MITTNDISGIRAHVNSARNSGSRIALVPTMGALHAGHLALVSAARTHADVVVVSIFVNPLQFGPGEDFSRYPRTLEADAEKLAQHGASILFTPSAAEMYGDGPRTTVVPRAFANTFEGAIRPGHFTGVLTVVAKLFNLVVPDVAVFGRKDLQQLALITGMVVDLNFPLTVLDVDTVRERDGLALSSRNRYLSDADRARASRIRAALVEARSAFEAGLTDAAELEQRAKNVLAEDAALQVDYVAVVRESDFARPAVAAPGDSIVTAVRLGGTHLIDNILL
ncbi:MAG: pantoate--beta-alanine ligase [Gemmatimonadaceae bacterium]